MLLVPRKKRNTSRRPLPAEAPQRLQQPRSAHWPWWLGGIFLLTSVWLTLFVSLAVVKEIRTSERQAEYFTALESQFHYQLAPGPSPSIRFPSSGPYDERLGYTRLPAMISRLLAGAYLFDSQVRLSLPLQQFIEQGFFPPYDEKPQAGLRLLDRHGTVLFQATYPEQIYSSFANIPDLLVRTLLFIENRELLDPRYPHHNPAVEWDRLAKAILDKFIALVKRQHHVAGGSTLATQIEKFRHSPGGQTSTTLDKFRQMLSASIRAYRQGINTLDARQQIVLDYINAIPLSALPGYGEVHGLSDGLWAWYVADARQINHLLALPEADHDATTRAAKALAYKQALSLFVAQRRPSYYLRDNPQALVTHTERYLRLLYDAGIISATLRDAALQAPLHIRRATTVTASESFAERKTEHSVRISLLALLKLSNLYELDHLDLTVHSTIDQERQEDVAMALRSLHSPEYLQTAGLWGKRLLNTTGDPSEVLYSLILFERGNGANLLRINVDNIDQPFDMNRDGRLDLGSTAKLRTLISYLEIIARLHHTYAGLSRQTLQALRIHSTDALRAWVVRYLQRQPEASLPQLLDAAMTRRYSASPSERFYTGGGLHSFANFDRSDNGRVLPVHEAFRRSVNLVFIRMMRDIVRFYMYQKPDTTVDLLEDTDHPQRQVYLERFAEREGRTLIRRFYRRYTDKLPEAMLRALLGRMASLTPKRLTVLYGALQPYGTFEAYTVFMHTHLPRQQLSEETLRALFERDVVSYYTLADRGYLTRLPPLELWTVRYLLEHPQASLPKVLAASTSARQEVSEWLLSTRNKRAQDNRIHILLETEAFQDIHQDWQRLGYPFASLVPSYATAIGSSGDRPDALATLMGIVVNDGMRYPTVSVEQFLFAVGTPYETRMHLASGGERVLPAAVTAVVKQALFDVVEHGTAQRLHGTFRRQNGQPMRVGGKTGTGDHRYKRFKPNGELLTSHVVSRTATFVFMIDERFFGTITAYVPGAQAADYQFTSALAVQILKSLAPTLQPLWQSARQGNE